MTTRNVFRLVVTLALVFAVAGGYGVFTAKASMDSRSSVFSGNVGPIVSGVEHLTRTKFAHGSAGGLALPVATFTLIDGASLGCPGPGTCTFTADERLQLITTTGTSNWAVLSYVDGTLMSGGGPYEGVIGTDYAVGSWSESSAPVNPGGHTIQTFGYMRDNPGLAYNYNFEYRVYKP